MEKVIIEIEAKTGKAEKGVDNIEKSLQDVADALAKVNKEFTETNKDTVKGLDKTEKGLEGVEGGSKSASKGLRGIGTAWKAIGFGAILGILKKFGDLLMENQDIADAVNGVFEAMGIVVKQITSAFADTFKKVSEATGGFDALGKVLGGALTIAINSVVGVVQGLVLGVKKAQLAWENSFFGDKDPETIKRLQEEIEEVGTRLDETGNKIKNGGKQIADNFTEAVGEVGSLATGVAKAVSNSIKEIDVKSALADGKRLVASKNNFERLAQQQQRLVEQYDLQAERLRQIRDDESKSTEERVKANDELGKVLLEQNEAEKKTVQARIDALHLEQRLKGKSVELSNEIFELQTEMLAIDAKVAGFESEQQTNKNSLLREQLELNTQQKESDAELELQRQLFNANLIKDIDDREAKLKEINDAEEVRKRKELETTLANAKAGTQAYVDAKIALNEFNEEERQKDLQKDVDAKLQKQEVLNQIDDALAVTEEEKEALRVEKEIEATTKRYDRLIEQAKKFGLDTVELEKKKADALDGINKGVSKNAIDWEKSTKEEKMAIASEGLNTLTSVLGEESAAGKAAAIGSAIISTYESANNAFNSLSPIPIVGPALGAVAAAGAVASGIANVKKIKSTPTYGGKSVAAPSVSAPSAPSLPPAFNVVGSSNASQLSDAIAGSTNSQNNNTQEVAEKTSSTPIKTYVVASDVTTAQSLDRNIVDNASL